MNYFYNNFRICFLGERILRIERSRRGKFCDENTFFIPDRAAFSKEQTPSCRLEGNILRFSNYELMLPAGKSLSGLCLKRDGKVVYRYKKLKNSGELPPPSKTPEVFALADCPRIFPPEGGYSAARKGEYRIEETAEDVYLLLSDGDPKLLRKLYVQLTGRCGLVRLATLGSWNSKYYAYTQREAEEVILSYERYGIPLDNIVIDTDWRLSENGMGYEVNERLFPDLKGFFGFAHSHNVEVMFNDHPEPLGGASVFAPKEIAYREKSLQALLKMGLDTWWYDRNWMTHLISPTKDVQWETFGLYLFHDVTERYYASAAGEDPPRRPVVMGNVAEVSNGVYGGISDSASHRYGIQWTGDIDSTADALAQEVEDLVRCTDNCIAYMNSDCGGHTGNPDKAQFIRWMQYGALSPILRPHCTNTVLRTREPWLYDGETLQIVRDFVLLRYRLLPYLYANAYGAYCGGVGPFRSLPMEYPKDRRAQRRDEYLLGKNLLIAPIAGVVPKLLEEGDYTAPVDIVYYLGRECAGEPIAREVRKDLCINLRHEPPMEGVPVYDFSARVKTKVKFDAPRRLYIRNDDGATVYLDGECVLCDRNTHSASLTRLKDLEAGREYSLEIKYFQAGGEAFLGLYAGEVTEADVKEVYLPAGRWMDVFDGEIYTGGQTVKKRYPLSAMPLFVRLGALIPLAASAQNTKEQSWEKLTYDFYPDKKSRDEGELYEDDGETVAYKSGACAISSYRAEYLPEERAFAVHIDAARGKFAGARHVGVREVTVKYHLLKGVSRIARVTVDGEKFYAAPCERGGVPLDAALSAPDAPTLSVSFPADTSVGHTVKFFLKK